MAIVFALLSALGFGVGDFAGGVAARRTTVATVVVGSHILGLVLVTALAPLLAERFDAGDLVLGGLGGLFGLIGVVLLYRGLAVGPMSVVAPLTAVTSAAVPAMWSFASGERPTTLAGIGLVVGLVAIVAVSSESPDESSVESEGRLPDVVRAGEQGRTIAIVSALAAGSAFGALFVVLDQTASDTAPWPVVGGRIASVSVLVIYSVLRKSPIVAPRSARPMIVIAGVCDVGANVTFLLATQRGLLSLVSVLSALYPVVTVLLARAVLNERISRTQFVGMALALAATTSIALG